MACVHEICVAIHTTLLVYTCARPEVGSGVITKVTSWLCLHEVGEVGAHGDVVYPWYELTVEELHPRARAKPS